MLRTKYTENQILCGMQECWCDFVGTDNDEIFDADDRIDLYLKEYDVWDEFDFYQLAKVMEGFFQFSCSENEWKELFGVNPSKNTLEEWEELVGHHLTFRVLAQFITERAPAVSFQPVRVIDRTCAPAGAFYGLKEVVGNVTVATQHPCQVAPSTKIIDALRGNTLEKFWSKLRWITEEGVPELRGLWVTIEAWGCLAGILGMLAGVLFSIVAENGLYLTIVPVSILLAWYVSSLYKYYVNPLPPELVTFRDLAMLIAAHDCDAVRKCEATEH